MPEKVFFLQEMRYFVLVLVDFSSCNDVLEKILELYQQNLDVKYIFKNTEKQCQGFWTEYLI